MKFVRRDHHIESNIGRPNSGMILQALFVVASAAIYVSAQQPCLNAPENPHSFAASPLSCAHYTLCLGGNTITGDDLRCGPGLYFDPPTQTCGQTSCTECSPFGIQNLPHPDNCYQYVECILGNRQILTCPNDLLFDRTVGQCNLPHLVYCPGAPTNPPEFTTPPIGDDTTLPPYDTDTPPTYTTPPPITDPPTLPPTLPPSLPVCTGGQVYHAHPTDCTRFFLCINNVIWSRECPNNLYWNQRINVCDLPASAGCVVGGGGGGIVPPTDPPLFPPADNPWTEPTLLPPNPNQ